ncbi:hypothetical protein AGMMS49942_02360 [Spirochaetia bacterium]|nr:hypothetical protein AGMMS49942_02360 [Spirochaetia bacterium]
MTGIISLLLVFGMILAGCDNGSTSGGDNSSGSGGGTSPGGTDPGGTDPDDSGETVPATTLSGALTWLVTNAEDQGEYVIELAGNESSGPRTLSYPGKSVTIILRGGGSEKTVSLSPNGSLFTISSGVKLVLDSNITLQGLPNNNTVLVRVSGGTLVMNNGSKITGNTSSALFSGGGVYVDDGTFTMTGGTISGNGASLGGGVNGNIIKTGGTITSTNSAANGKVAYSDPRKRNAEAGPGVNLDYRVSGSEGGWE